MEKSLRGTYNFPGTFWNSGNFQFPFCKTEKNPGYKRMKTGKIPIFPPE